MSVHEHPAKVYPVHPQLKDSAVVKGLSEYQAMYEKSLADSDAFWADIAQRIDWFSPWHQVSQCDFSKAQVAWFLGAKLNVAHNCIDRHLKDKADQTAIIWEADDPADTRHISYRELHEEVCRAANALKAHGVQHGDRVCIYLPMIPELAYVMLACARIGAVHSIVFAGFSADALKDRILDCEAKVVVTADEGLRGGKAIGLKAITDQALEQTPCVSRLLVVRRTGAEVNMVAGRDCWYHEEVAKQRPTCPAAWVDAEDPLFILYTSGSTGKPKGVLHTSGGYITYASFTHQYVFDYRPGDIYFCAADIGWITGHSYIIYGPLANGATTIMFESTPLYPDAGRYWDVVERHKVNIFYTAPTAIRALAAEGDAFVKKYDRSSLRVMGTVGEPINPEAWGWYHDVVGDGRCAVVDTWWQTETGGIMITPQPGVNDMKPGSATLPFYGIEPVIVDEACNRQEDVEATGLLCMGRAWPGMARTVYGDHQRYVETYFSRVPGYYFTGDGCRRDKDGCYWITGRVDDVLNVSGHRLGTAEIEASINACDWIAESAVVGCHHDIKGTGIFAFVVLNRDNADHKDDFDAVFKTVREQVTADIGKIARPDHILISTGLPKTRSGKIMRRILRNIAKNEYEDMGNISTLADPSVVALLIEGHRKQFNS